MTLEAPVAPSAAATNPAGRWRQLVCGLVCIVMIANLQYGWTLFVNPIDQKYHWGVPAIQVAFSVFVATETWLVPVEGWLPTRYRLCVPEDMSHPITETRWVAVLGP